MKKRSREEWFFDGAFAGAALLAAGGWLWAWHALSVVSGPLILHFSDYTGINQIGGMADIHEAGATAVIIVGLNFILARALRQRDPRLAYIMAGATLFLAALLFTALAAIISVNR